MEKLLGLHTCTQIVTEFLKFDNIFESNMQYMEHERTLKNTSFLSLYNSDPQPWLHI